MKIAVPCDGNTVDSSVSPSFGRCIFYMIVDIKILKAVPGTVKHLIEQYDQGMLEELKEIHPGHHGRN